MPRPSTGKPMSSPILLLSTKQSRLPNPLRDIVRERTSPHSLDFPTVVSVKPQITRILVSTIELSSLTALTSLTGSSESQLISDWEEWF